jgi:hypothetical protein
MRCTAFDKDEIRWLKRIGFTIADDQESAAFRELDVQINIIMPYHSEFLVTTELPNGYLLLSFMSRSRLERAADIDPELEEDENEET